MEEGNEWISDIWRPLVTKKEVQNHLRRGLSGKTKGRVFPMYLLLVSPSFFPPHFPWKYQSTLTYFPVEKNVVHSGTLCTCAHTIFPWFLSLPSHKQLYCPSSSMGFPLIFFLLSVHFARKAKGRDLHTRKWHTSCSELSDCIKCHLTVTWVCTGSCDPSRSNQFH